MDGFADLPLGARVAVALSGGVDSSVVAALLKERGYEVVGATLRLHDLPGAEKSVQDAAQVAAKLGLSHRVLDLRETFARDVVQPFAASYAAGETPLPCALCNRFVKFGGLIPFARELGAQALATGHYVRRILGAAGPELHRATDARKDQSYFLFAMTPEQLSFLRFPLGDFSGKDETRALAARLGLPVADKPDSQDICFVPGDDYASVVRGLRPDADKPGVFVTAEGEEVGRHDGILHYTVGQRRGLNLGARQGDHNEPLFVLRLEAATGRVIVGPRTALARRTVFLRGVNWLANDIAMDILRGEGLLVEAKLRSAQAPVAARFFIEPGPEGQPCGRLDLATPVQGVAPGQAGVVYRGDRLLGGGWIADSV